MEAQGAKVRCQRIGCDAMFTEDDNPDGSCTYHDSPLFHDGMKEWSCCKKRSHDFSLFLEIPGCKTGKHTTEKQVLKKPPETQKKPVSAPATSIAAPSNQACSRCRQGFFCSEHGSKPGGVNPNAVAAAPAESSSKIQDGSSAPAKKVVDIFQPQTCSNKGCGKTFKEKDNHETACSYHPGRAVFHDRSKGWSCCDVHVKEFEEFMSIPPCSQGWHSADPVS